MHKKKFLWIQKQYYMGREKMRKDFMSFYKLTFMVIKVYPF